jgi:hypothetical protein
VDSKQLCRVDIKDAAKGEVTAVFSTFDVIDSDGDVTLADAFDGNGDVVISSYGHSSWGSGVPIGKGRIFTNKNEAILEGRFFMDTQAGKDTFAAVKALGELGQWSYGFDILDSETGDFKGERVRFLKKLKVWEVSPVLVGAGVGTRTLQAKSGTRPGTRGEPEPSYKAAIRPHASAATNREWDGPAVVAGLADGSTVTELRSVFAWVDPNGDPEAKSSYKFPHHHGVDGPANVRALMAGIAVLNGARGGWNGSEEDRKAIYNHLAGHLRDADREPPELRSLNGGALKLHEKSFEVLDGISDYLEHAETVVAVRAEAGKSLSQINLEALDWVGEALQDFVSRHKSLVRRARNAPNEAAAEEFVRYLAMQRRAAQ